MRSGKRVLAGVAAVALSAGVLSFVGAAPAQAAVSSISLSESGLQVVPPAANSADDTAAFPVTVSLLNAAGTAVALDGETLSASVISWPGDPRPAWNDDSYIALAGTQANATDMTGNSSQTITSFTAVTTGVVRFWVKPPIPDNTTGWRAATTAGNSIIRVTVTTTATGATVTRDFPVTVSASGITPLGNLTYTNATGTSIVNAGSDDSGATATAYRAYVKLTNSAGQALLMPGSLSASLSSGSTANGTLTTTIPSGGLIATGATGVTSAVYAIAPAGNTWVAGNRTLTTTYATPTATTADLPITISTGGVAAPSSVLLTTTPATARSASAPNYQVPDGTTTLSFTAATTSTSGTIAWQASSSAAGAQITPSAGVAAVTAAGTYSVNVTLNTAAANSGRVTFTTGAVDTTVDPVDLVAAVTSGPTFVGKVGTAVTVTGTLTDQFERPLAGVDVVSIARLTPSATGVLDSQNVKDDGSFSLTIPATAAPATTPADYTFRITGNGGGLAAATADITVQYTATGEVTSVTVTTTPTTVTGNVPAILVPGAGSVNLANGSTAIVSPTSIPTAAPTGTNAVFTATVASVPASSLTLTGSEGVYFSTAATGTVNWNGGVSTVTVGSGSAVTVWSTKAGVNTVTVTAGTKSTTQQFVAFTQAAFARNVALTPVNAEVDKNTFTPVTLKVTDVFGNPVRGVAVGTAATNPGVTLNVAGGGGIGTIAGTTTGAGELAFAYTAPTASGTAQVSAAGAGAQFATSITGASAPTATATATFVVRDAASKSIVIVGERTTVSGKSGIMVDGVVKGIENGKTVKPFIRFPGQTTFTEGTARPVIQAGEFTWQRKTGKRVTVYVTSDDGATVSNRVTIQAS